MKKEDYMYFCSWFEDYLSSFHTNDNYIDLNIRLKKEHTYGVCRNVVMIGKQLGMDKNQLMLAETTALFHDLGRFEQMKMHRTLKDNLSFDHAEQAVKLLDKKKVLKNLSKEEQEIVFKAIKNHSTLKINEEPGRCLFYIKLLRDADKLTILPDLIGYYEKQIHDNPAMEFELPDLKGYSENVVKEVLNYGLVNKKNLNEYNDLMLYLLSWIYDINFWPSFCYIKKNKYIDRLIELLPQTEDIKAVRRHFDEYLEKMSEGDFDSMQN
ncbi:HD domain-containing protein [Thermoproteota archaeon]